MSHELLLICRASPHCCQYQIIPLGYKGMCVCEQFTQSCVITVKWLRNEAITSKLPVRCPNCITKCHTLILCPWRVTTVPGGRLSTHHNHWAPATSIV